MYAKIGLFRFYRWAISSITEGRFPSLKRYLKDVGAAKFNVKRPFFSMNWVVIPEGACVTLNLT